jgi:tripartite-type tricarboxylate transporter receptor subunit TctC
MITEERTMPGARSIATALLAAAILPAQAQTYPSKPIRVIVPLPAGGSIDNVFRIASDRFQQLSGQPFVIDNRPGASGVLAAETVMRAPADGYTVLAASVTMMSINPHTFAKLAYDPQKDFVPVSNVYRTNYFWVTSATVPASNIKDFVAWARTSPGKASFGSAGVGSISHLASAMFNQAAKIELLHVPYKGAVQSMTDLLAGRISAVFAPIVAFGEHMKTGQVRVLAAATDKRVGSMPDVPTFLENGFEVVAPLWTGVVAPAGTPAAVVSTLNRHLVDTLTTPDVRERLLKGDQEPVPNSPSEFADFMRQDRERWGRAVKASGLKPSN